MSDTNLLDFAVRSSFASPVRWAVALAAVLAVARPAAAEIPKDTDGFSLVPELLGQQATGREQQQHQYLYWEIGNQTAVRMGLWKAYRKGGEQAPWRLYDLSKDIGETTDVAAQNPDVLARLKAFAAEAHRPMPHGEVYDRALVEKDRRGDRGRRRWVPPRVFLV